MARYIDAVKAADIIIEKMNIPLSDLVDVFAEIPNADVVEVVRCKDCKNRNGFFCPIEKESATAHWFEDEDYCSFGERKENK